jgi:hypothetical protein
MKNRKAWGLVVVLAVVVLIGVAALVPAFGWRLEILPPNERGFGRCGAVPDGPTVALDRNKLRLGLVGVYKTPLVRDRPTHPR